MSNAPSEVTPLVEGRGIVKHFTIHHSFLARLLAGKQNEIVRAVDGVTISIWPGETLGLVGESGCGKTTLGRVLTRLYEPTAGELRFRGKPVVGDYVAMETSGNGAGLRRMPYYRLTQIIFQNPYSSLNPRRTIRDILTVPMQARGVRDAQALESELQRLLERVGLSPGHADRYPHQFSGGQRQRIGIARALAMNPEFVVADEPVSSLDVSIQAQVINLLEELQNDLHLTYLFIAHDLSLIHHISRRVAVMYLGHIVEEGPVDQVFQQPQHPYTQALLAAVPVIDKAKRRQRVILAGDVPSPIDPPAGCPFHPRCFAKVGPICEQEMPPVFGEGGRAGHRVACWLLHGRAPVVEEAPVAASQETGPQDAPSPRPRVSPVAAAHDACTSANPPSHTNLPATGHILYAHTRHRRDSL